MALGADKGLPYIVEEDGSHREVSPDKLPPITHVQEPLMRHMSTRIRWWIALGFSVKEVSHFLGCRYQMVRNVMVTQPKRAIREDVPALEIKLHDIDDDLEAMDKMAMQQQMSAQRAEASASRKALNQLRRDLNAEEIEEGDDGE